MDEVALAERLIAYDTSRRQDVRLAMDFAAGWLESRDVQVEKRTITGRECLTARVGDGPLRILFHAHVDVVPAHPDQFVPRIEDGLLYGRGAYDMKGAMAAMMLALADLAPGVPGVTTELVVTPDEERAEPGANTTEMLVQDGLRADFVICGEPTDLHVGVQAKGVLMLRIDVPGRSAHGSTPWLGENAILRAVEVFRLIEELPFGDESTALFARPSINLGRIMGGDAVNKVPDFCRIDVDIRFLPGQDPEEIMRQVRGIGPLAIEVLLERPPAYVPADHPMVEVLLESVGRHERSVASVGRDGASDAVAFLGVGVPAVEFGPRGAGHHGPDEHVDVASLGVYRKALGDFVRRVAESDRGKDAATVPVAGPEAT